MRLWKVQTKVELVTVKTSVVINFRFLFSYPKKRISSLCTRPVEGCTQSGMWTFVDNDVWTYEVLQAVLFVQKQNKNGVWLLMH